MRKLITLFMLLCWCAAFSPAVTMAAEAPVLSVSGQGTAETVPNQATIFIGVTSYAKNAQMAQQDNALKAAAIQNSLLKLGIAKTAIKTADYSFYPNYNNEPNREAKIIGYTVDNTVIVSINDVSRVGTIIDAVLSSGANKINSLNFSATNIKEVEQQALIAATKDARNKADAIAAGLGRRIIGIKSASENGSIAPRRSFDTMLMSNAAGATPISAGTLELSASVHIEYLLSE